MVLQLRVLLDKATKCC